MTTVNSFLNNKSKDVFEAAALGTQRPIEDRDFLSYVPDPLSSFVQKALAGTRYNTMETKPKSGEGDNGGITNSNSAKDTAPTPAPATKKHRLVDEYRLSTRSHLLSLTNTLLESNSDAAIVEETVEELLHFIRNVIDVCLTSLKDFCFDKNNVPGFGGIKLSKFE